MEQDESKIIQLNGAVDRKAKVEKEEGFQQRVERKAFFEVDV